MIMRAALLAPEGATARAVAKCWPVFAGITLLMLGNGLQGTLLGSRATLAGFGDLVTGVVMAGYFAGFVVSAEGTPRLIRRIGHVRCYAAFASCASVAVLVHGLLVEPAVSGPAAADRGRGHLRSGCPAPLRPGARHGQ